MSNKSSTTEVENEKAGVFPKSRACYLAWNRSQAEKAREKETTENPEEQNGGEENIEEKFNG